MAFHAGFAVVPHSEAGNREVKRRRQVLLGVWSALMKEFDADLVKFSTRSFRRSVTVPFRGDADLPAP